MCPVIRVWPELMGRSGKPKIAGSIPATTPLIIPNRFPDLGMMEKLPCLFFCIDKKRTSGYERTGDISSVVI